MRIGDLNPEQNISLIVTVNGTTLNFKSKVQEAYPRQNTIIADAFINNGKPVSFRGDNITVNVLTNVKEDKPIIFKEVSSKLLKKNNGEYCYSFSSSSEGLLFNRRENFRCYVGIESSMQCGLSQEAYPAIIKDISYSGFSVVSPTPVPVEVGQLIHTAITDQPKENGPVYSFQLFGVVVRIQKMSRGKILYGCRMNNTVTGLDKYIMEKQRVHLRSTNGGNL